MLKDKATRKTPSTCLNQALNISYLQDKIVKMFTNKLIFMNQVINLLYILDPKFNKNYSICPEVVSHLLK